MMNRPYVNVTGKNSAAEKRDILARTLERFTSLDGIVGVSLHGGLSRGYADELSEIDITVFLDEKGYKNYLESIYPIANGITMIDGALFDIKIVGYEEEAAREYDSVAQWDLSYAEILYDPFGRLAAFREREMKEVEPSSAEGAMFQAWWNYRLAGDIWIKRKYAVQGHFVLNNAIKPLLSALFVCNREFVPHEKWIIHMSRTLNWKPDNWDGLLNDMIAVPDSSLNSLIDRQAHIDQIWRMINQKLCAELRVENLDITQRGTFGVLKYLADASPHSCRRVGKAISG